MKDEKFERERDKFASDHVLSNCHGELDEASLYSSGVEDGIKIGADWARDYLKKEIEEKDAIINNLTDTIKEVIRNSHDIMAKKLCSRSLAEALEKTKAKLKGTSDE